MALDYPKTRTEDVSDDFFGTQVADPYRWLEDSHDDEVLAWTQQQHDLAVDYLKQLPERDTYKSRLKQVWDYPKYGVPRRRGEYLFYTYNDGLQNQPVLYVKQGDDGDPRVLLDPNRLTDDGTVALTEWRPTPDGTKIMLSLSDNGTDWRTFRFMDVATGEYLDDVIENVKFSWASWRDDGSGFYYSTFPPGTADEGENNQDVSHQVYFHQMGASQADDEVVFRTDLKGITIYSEVSYDDRFLTMRVQDSFATNRLYAMDIETGEVMRWFDESDARYEYIWNEGNTFYIWTTKDAPNGRLVAFERDDPQTLREVIPESDRVIDGIATVQQQFVIAYMEDAHHVLHVYDIHGGFQHEIPLPETGTTVLMNEWPYSHELFLPFLSFLQPLQILRYDFTTRTIDPYFEVTVPDFDPDNYETRQVFYPSNDGTRVPMFITARKDIELTGDNPTILYGYGGFGVNLTPMYRSWLPVWLEEGGVFAQPCLRGGGEYGDVWHHDGMLERKQNTFDDFIAAAEWLIDNKWTSTDCLAIEGGSNGGLLVAACMIQRPDLFGAVLSHVPVIDMLRYQHFSAGRYWTTEYGDATASQDEFEYLYAYSPLHNIQQNTSYPPLLILTADHDDRVVPMHSKKFAAALQAADTGDNLILLRIETKVGHGMGTPTSRLIDKQADIFAFLSAHLNHTE